MNLRKMMVLFTVLCSLFEVKGNIALAQCNSYFTDKNFSLLDYLEISTDRDEHHSGIYQLIKQVDNLTHSPWSVEELKKLVKKINKEAEKLVSELDSYLPTPMIIYPIKDLVSVIKYLLGYLKIYGEYYSVLSQGQSDTQGFDENNLDSKEYELLIDKIETSKKKLNVQVEISVILDRLTFILFDVVSKLKDKVSSILPEGLNAQESKFIQDFKNMVTHIQESEQIASSIDESSDQIGASYGKLLRSMNELELQSENEDIFVDKYNRSFKLSDIVEREGFENFSIEENIRIRSVLIDRLRSQMDISLEHPLFVKRMNRYFEVVDIKSILTEFYRKRSIWTDASELEFQRDRISVMNMFSRFISLPYEFKQHPELVKILETNVFKQAGDLFDVRIKEVSSDKYFHISNKLRSYEVTDDSGAIITVLFVMPGCSDVPYSNSENSFFPNSLPAFTFLTIREDKDNLLFDENGNLSGDLFHELGHILGRTLPAKVTGHYSQDNSLGLFEELPSMFLEEYFQSLPMFKEWFESKEVKKIIEPELKHSILSQRILNNVQAYKKWELLVDYFLFCCLYSGKDKHKYQSQFQQILNSSVLQKDFSSIVSLNYVLLDYLNSCSPLKVISPKGYMLYMFSGYVASRLVDHMNSQSMSLEDKHELVSKLLDISNPNWLDDIKSFLKSTKPSYTKKKK